MTPARGSYRVVPYADGVRIAGQAIRAGAVRRSAYYYFLDQAGDCEAPISVEVSTRHYVDRPVPPAGLRGFVRVDRLVRCRRCRPCREQRRRRWAARALIEYEAARRTWLITLTLRPDVVGLYSVRSVKGRGSRWARLSAMLNRDVTLYLKRVRKRGRFRYMAVLEAHKSGVPHAHIVLHEVDQALTERVLRGAWGLGFVRAKLVRDSRGATYASKYLVKDLMARVRASSYYGNPATLVRARRSRRAGSYDPPGPRMASR